MMKTTFVLLASLPATCIWQAVGRYFSPDWSFAVSIVILIVLDTVLSIVKHLVHNDASSEDFWKGTSKKCFVYMVLMITANILYKYTVNGERMASTEWISDYICVAMVLREVISIIENSNGISPWLPANLLKRLKDFNENGEYIKKDVEK